MSIFNSYVSRYQRVDLSELSAACDGSQVTWEIRLPLAKSPREMAMARRRHFAPSRWSLMRSWPDDSAIVGSSWRMVGFFYWSPLLFRKRCSRVESCWINMTRKRTPQFHGLPCIFPYFPYWNSTFFPGRNSSPCGAASLAGPRAAWLGQGVVAAIWDNMGYIYPLVMTNIAMV